MAMKLKTVTIVLIAIFTLIAILSFPGYYQYFYKAGTGHAFQEIVISNNLLWDTMTEIERAPYLSTAKAEGIKCAIFMTLGQYLPFYLFVIITILFLASSVSATLKMNLRFTFVGVWIFGLFFLSIGSGYWGSAIPFPQSIGPALIIYLIVAILFGIVISVGIFFKRIAGKRPFKHQGKKNSTINHLNNRQNDTLSQTLLKNFRLKYSQYNKYSDEQIIKAYRKKNPQYNDKSDIWIIKYLENKTTK